MISLIIWQRNITLSFTKTASLLCNLEDIFLMIISMSVIVFIETMIWSLLRCLHLKFLPKHSCFLPVCGCVVQCNCSRRHMVHKCPLQRLMDMGFLLQKLAWKCSTLLQDCFCDFGFTWQWNYPTVRLQGQVIMWLWYNGTHIVTHR